MSPDPRTLHAGQANIVKLLDFIQLSGNAKVLEDFSNRQQLNVKGLATGRLL